MRNGEAVKVSNEKSFPKKEKNSCWIVGRFFFCWSMLNIFVFSSSLLLFLIWIKKKKPPINFDNTGSVLKSAKQRGKNNTCLNITYNYAFFV